MEKLEIKSSIGYHDPKIVEDALSVRTEVFVEEQGFDLAIEVDEYDNSALHIVAYLNQQPVAVSRAIFKENNTLKIGRVAVIKTFRNRHLASRIMNYIEEYSKAHNIHQLVLSAQGTAVPFYLKNGYISVGEPYLEEGVEHLFMQKSI